MLTDLCPWWSLTSFIIYYYYLIELQMGFHPVAVVLQYNAHITQNNTTLKQNAAHKFWDSTRTLPSLHLAACRLSSARARKRHAGSDR
jgi:hypothetical protein